MPVTLETISNDSLQPTLYAEEVKRLVSSKFGVSLTLAKGTVLGKKTSDSKLYAYIEPNDVQTVTFAGTPTATGLLYLIIIDKDGKQVRTEPVTFSATLATLVSRLQTATDAALATNAIVWAGVSGTTNPIVTATFSGTNYAAIKQTLIRVETEGMTQGNVKVEHSTTYTGLETAIGFLSVAIVTDSSGNIFLGDSATGGTANPPVASVPVVIGGGAWDTTALTGYDAAIITDLGGRLLHNGLLFLPR